MSATGPAELAPCHAERLLNERPVISLEIAAPSSTVVGARSAFGGLGTTVVALSMLPLVAASLLRSRERT